MEYELNAALLYSTQTQNNRFTPAADAMKAFCGLPKTVAALPMFAQVAIPSVRGSNSL